LGPDAKAVRVWDAETGKQRAVPMTHTLCPVCPILTIFITKEESYFVISIVRVSQRRSSGPGKQLTKARSLQIVGWLCCPKGLEFAAESEQLLQPPPRSYLRHRTLRHRRSSTAFEAAIKDALDGMRCVQPNTNSEPTR